MTSRWGRFLENALPGTASTESYASLERELAARNVELSEAREQQAATAEVLEVIGASGADAAPVFDKILHSCARHFKTLGSAITVIGADGLLHMAAMHSHAVSFGDEGSSSPEELDAMRERVRSHYPRPVAGTGVEAAVRAGGMLWFPDVLNGPDVPEGLREPVRAMGVNWSQIVAPLMRGDAIVGALSLTRPVGMAFTDRERALLKTFADQAAIAVQNARLFNETREALEHQTATAEVLRVIGGSVADTRPVFDTILQSCARLFNVQASVIMQIGDDGLLHMEALHAHAGDHARQQELEGSLERMRSLYPIPLAGSATAMALDARRVLNFPDVMNGAGVPAALRAPAEAAGLNYSLIMAPLMQGERGIGSIALTRDQLGGFTEKEEALLRSFADQAVIAIQNARLFNETKEALERQTATTEVLQVINASPGELRPVFDAIVERASRLCEADYGGLWLVSGGRARFSTGQSDAPPAFAEYLRSMPDSVGISAFLGRDGAPGGYLHVPDIREIDGYHERQPFVVAMVELGNVRTGLNVPLVDESRAVVGVFTLVRTAVRPFTAAQIALVQSFAAQAQIAMKNARLMRETQESLEQQTASAEVLKVISSSVADAAPVFEKILESCQRLFASNEQGVLLLGEDGLIHLGAHHGSARPRLEKLFPVPRETGGEAASGEGSVAHFKDILNDPEVPPRMRAIAEGIGVGTFSQVIAPMLWEGELIGSLYVIRQPPVGFSDKEIGLLRTFADQAVIAIQNSRLFNEIQAKSRELEQANKHKSEFLANMSHELRTPLNAIIGFSEVLSEKMFGEVNDKQLEYLRDIHSSGHHLLSLINDILDLSKIEAGRMELDLASTSLPMLLDNCSTLVRERASRQGLVLALEVEPGVGDWVADVRKLKQVVINLLSNAVKFTPAGGRVTLRARRLERAVEIAVVDTGVGIARDQQALVFEEFRQAGGDYLRKSEGTGLGLSLARRFVELHGGTIRVESEPGQGSTFAFVLPERVLEAI